jgi:hypothetical protein
MADRSTTELTAVGAADPTAPRWLQWQTDVVALLRDYLHAELATIGVEDIDWPSWHPFFIQGRSPRAAIDRALERDL